MGLKVSSEHSKSDTYVQFVLLHEQTQPSFTLTIHYYLANVRMLINIANEREHFLITYTPVHIY